MNRGFSLLEALMSALLLAATVAIAGQVLFAVDSAVAKAPRTSTWAAIAAVAIAEDIRQARLVTVSADRLLIDCPGRPRVVWSSRNSVCIRSVRGHIDRRIPVPASFARRGPKTVAVRCGPSLLILAGPRAGRVVGGEQ